MKKSFFAAGLSGYLLFCGFCARAAEYKLEIPIPGVGNTFSDANAGAFLAEYLNAIFKFGFSVVAFLSVAMIVYGGILYMVPGKIDEAKQRIWGAAIGIIFLACSFLLLQTIDPNLTNLRLSILEKFDVPNSPHEGFTFTTDEVKSLSTQLDTDYGSLIGAGATKNGITPELVKAVIQAESGGRPNVCSKDKNGNDMACGLMQLMPGTFKQYSGGLGDEYRKDPGQNVAAGTKYLSYLVKKYNGDTATALAAYNWGPGNVDKKCGGNVAGCSLPKETANYIPKVLGYMRTIKSQS